MPLMFAISTINKAVQIGSIDDNISFTILESFHIWLSWDQAGMIIMVSQLLPNPTTGIMAMLKLRKQIRNPSKLVLPWEPQLAFQY